MATTQVDPGPKVAADIVDTIEKGEHSALKAVRQFVDAVDDALPVAVPGDGDEASPRRQIIDAAFRMVDQIMGTTNDFVRGILTASEGATATKPAAKAGAKN